MRSDSFIKRRRGGQPGNQNAKFNRGNKNARGKLGNRGGGAPFGNQNARKKSKAPLEFLKLEYRHSNEAIEWLERHAGLLSDLKDDNQRDAALYAAFCGLTSEAIARQGREYQLGLYTLVEEEDEAA